jgi:hypothetical protein
MQDKYKYIEEVNDYRVKKKVVGARVPESLVDALNSAASDTSEIGFKLSITKIIEKALEETLIELRRATGIDYYELERFRHEMRNLLVHSNSNTSIDMDKIINEIKDDALKSKDRLQTQRSIREGIRKKKSDIYSSLNKGGEGEIRERMAHFLENSESNQGE